VTYYSLMISQFAYRDRKEFRNDQGQLSFKAGIKKLGEYLATFGVNETIYGFIRTGAHYSGLAVGMSALVANGVAQSVGDLAILLVLPVVRYLVRAGVRSKREIVDN